MGLTLYKSKATDVSKVFTSDIMYELHEKLSNDYNNLYFESEEQLQIELDEMDFTADEKQEIIDYYNDNDLYGWDLEIC